MPSRSPSSTKLTEEERGTDAQLPGWAVVQRSTDKGRLYKVYYGPNGEYTESKRQALLLSSGEPFTAAQLAPKTKVGNGAAPRPSLHVPRSGVRARYSAGQYGEGDDGDESAVARGKPRTNGRMGKFAAAASGLDAPPRCPGTSALVRGRYGRGRGLGRGRGRGPGAGAGAGARARGFRGLAWPLRGASRGGPN